MRILVLSDSHGREDFAYKAVEQQPTASVVIHLGDGEADLERAKKHFPSKIFVQVAGNNDYFSLLPYDKTSEFDNVKIFFTHGHKHFVKHTLENVKKKANEEKCNILLFGHTHKGLVDYDDGLYIMNPGSVGGLGFCHASYGIIDITNAGIVCNIIKMRY